MTHEEMLEKLRHVEALLKVCADAQSGKVGAIDQPSDRGRNGRAMNIVRWIYGVLFCLGLLALPVAIVAAIKAWEKRRTK